MIAVVGEALVDLVARAKGPTAALQPCAGGSMFNLAVALGCQQVDVAFLGQLAADDWGRYLCRRLREAGVKVDFLSWSDRHNTSLALAQLGENGDSRYTFYLGDSADLQLPRHFARPAMAELEAVCFGSYSIGIPSFRAAVEPFLWQAAQSAVISFDPNIRPQPLPSADEYRSDWLRWLDLCDIIKMSEEDLAWVWPQRAEGEVLDQCFARRVSVCCLTRGEKGASVFHRGGARLDLPVLTGTKVADTIGAGDTFHGALLAHLSRQGKLSRQGLETLDEASLGQVARWAVAAAALNCEQAGCQPPSVAAVERRLQTVA